jgi:S1-C subfamily serine protease
MMIWRRLVPLLLFAALGGCIHLASQQEKLESFEPFANRHVGQETLGEYLEDRTAVLIAGAKPLSVRIHDGTIGVALKPMAADGKVDIGSAAAVDTDGYFLTAAHCLHRQPVFLVISTSSGPRGVVCRVVWRPPAGEENPCDMALVKIEVPLEHAFVIAQSSQIGPGLPVVTSGGNGEAGGHVLSITLSSTPKLQSIPPTYAVIHDIPLAQGDSGGPLTTLDGNLIGIQVLATGIFLGPRQGIALRPDPAWLRRQIDQDRLAHKPSQH